MLLSAHDTRWMSETLEMATTAPVKLYLGCGRRRIPGFIHVDPDPLSHVERIGPIDRLDMFADDSVDLIYASHVLEQFGRYQIFDVVSEWFRVLRSGGVLAGSDSRISLLLRLFHLFDTFNPVDPAGLLRRLQTAGFASVSVDAVAGRFRFRAGKE